MPSFIDLVTTIETELQIGEQLLHNLATQKVAVLQWNAAKLLEGLSEKELVLHQLQAAATQQSEFLSHSECASQERPSRLLELLVFLEQSNNVLQAWMEGIRGDYFVGDRLRAAIGCLGLGGFLQLSAERVRNVFDFVLVGQRQKEPLAQDVVNLVRG